MSDHIQFRVLRDTKHYSTISNTKFSYTIIQQFHYSNVKQKHYTI